MNHFLPVPLVPVLGTTQQSPVHALPSLFKSGQTLTGSPLGLLFSRLNRLNSLTLFL